MLVATENWDPMGSTVFKLLNIDKQTDKQRRYLRFKLMKNKKWD